MMEEKIQLLIVKRAQYDKLFAVPVIKDVRRKGKGTRLHEDENSQPNGAWFHSGLGVKGR